MSEDRWKVRAKAMATKFNVIEAELRLIAPWVDHEDTPSGDCAERCPACRLERVRLSINPCRCVGLQHREDCPEWEIPY